MLEYELVQAPFEQTIMLDCARTGRPLPDKMQNRPFVEEWDRFYYNAFAHLNTCRNFESGFIPYTSLMQYCQFMEVDDDQAEALSYVISVVDSWYLDFQAKKQKKKKSDGASGKKQRP